MAGKKEKRNLKKRDGSARTWPMWQMTHVFMPVFTRTYGRDGTKTSQN